MKGKQNSINLVSVPSYMCRGQCRLLSIFDVCFLAGGSGVGPCITQEKNDPEYIAAFDLQRRASWWECMSWLPPK